MTTRILWPNGGRINGVPLYLEVARVMHQSIPAVPRSPPPGYCGAFAWLVSPGGGAFANFALPGGGAFANFALHGGQASAYPGAIPKLLTRMWFPIRI